MLVYVEVMKGIQMFASTGLTPSFQSALSGLVRTTTTPAPSVALDPGTTLLSCELTESSTLVQVVLGIITVWAGWRDLTWGASSSRCTL